MTTNPMYTPWGWTQDIEWLAEGVWRVWTSSHGGLKLSRERWAEIPVEIRDAMFTPTFAEEDCEEPIVRTLLGLADEQEREMAVRVADYFERYAPALPFVRIYRPGLHHHVFFYWGGYGSDPFERFDNGEQARAFANDPEKVRWYGRMEAIECEQMRPLCLHEGRRP